MGSSNFLDNYYANEGVSEYAPSQNYEADDDFLDRYYIEEQKQRDAQIQTLLNSVADNDPDGTGEAQRLAKELGLPEGMTIDSADTLETLREKQRERLRQAHSLAMVNPILARQLSDPSFAAIAHDNLPRLAAHEKLWKGVSSVPVDGWQGIRKGVLSREMGKIANKLRGRQAELLSIEEGFDPDYVPSPQDLEDYERLKEINETIQNYDADGVGIIEGTGYFFGQYGSSIPEAAVAGLTTWGAKTAAGTAIGAISPDPFTTGGGAVIGNFVGLFTGWNAFRNKLAYDTFQIEGGHSWLELRENGYSMEDARLRSNSVGIANAVIESVGLRLISGPYARTLGALKGPLARSGLAKAPLVKLIQNRIFRQVGKNALGTSGKKLTWNGITQQFAKDYVTLLGTEVGQEIAQEMVAIAGNNVLADMSQEEIATISAEEMGDRIWSTATETAKGMILFGLIGPGITYSSNLSKAEKARNTTTVLEKIVELNKDDVTAKRNRDQSNDYQQNLADQAGVSDFYFNAEVFQQQLDKHAITEQQLELFSPELVQQLKDAKKEGWVGKVVKIPTGKYLTEIGGTELGNSLFPHVKPGENDYSQTEMIQFYKDKPQLLAAAREEIQQNKEILLQSTKESRLIKKQIAGQLAALNLPKITPRNAVLLAGLPQAFAGTYSRILGITPAEFINQYQYNIRGSEIDSKTFSKQFYNQDGTIKTETQLFKNWFRKSTLTNPDGTPQVLYHGTTDSFDYFDLDHPNRYDSGFAGTGVYLTPDKGLAKFYTHNKAHRAKGKKTIMELYARLENPKIIENTKKDDIKAGGKTASDGYRDQLIAEGHDGVIVKTAAGEVQEVVIFEPNAVKSIDNKGSWSNEINNIYEQKVLESFEQKGKQKRGRQVPQAVYQIANLVESFNFAEKNIYETNRDFKVAIQERIKAEAKKARVDLTEFTAEVEKYLVQTALEDARYALSENDNAIGWYDTTLTKAKAILSLIHPELATSPESNFAFVYALANTSNMIEVGKNLELAEQAYTHWKENGEFPTKIGIGDAAKAINRNFKLYNRLIKEKGFAELEEYMKTMHTVKEIETYTGDKVSGLNKTDMAYGAAVMGPKIGNGFFANLYGHYEQLTMDRWLIRTWGRMTGTLVIDYRKQAKVKREQLKPLIKALSLKDKKKLEAIINKKIRLSDLDGAAVAIQRASTSDANRELMNEIALVTDPKNAQVIEDVLGKAKKGTERIGIGSEIRKGGNALAKYNDGQKETPSGAPERRNITKVFEQVLSTLQQEQPDLTMADLQALLWYPEKRLYDSAKLNADEIVRGYEADEAPDYANASVNLAKQLGVAEADIQTTLEEVTNELERKATERTADSERGEGGTGGVRETDIATDAGTGLPLNPDGTVTVYHHTDRKSASRIESTGELRSAGEPDVYVTTRAIADTGYGDTAVTIRVEPSRLSLDDEFPNGRRDFRLSVGKPGGSVRVKAGEYSQQPESFRQDAARGRFEPTTLTTILTQEADFSTFAHETAHYMLSVLENIVSTDNAPQELTADFNTLLKFWGVKDLETWKGFSIDEKREYHEAFAYNFELYLFEGKAPSKDKGMLKLFKEFSRFIKAIYQDVSTRLNELYKKETGKDLPILTNEVRSVMDRMLATDEQIVQANQIYDMKALFQTQEQSGMNEAEWAAYQASLQEAEDESIAIMTQQSMRQVRWLNNARSKVLAKLQKDKKKLYKEVEAEVIEELKQDKRYKLQWYLKRGETYNDKGEVIKVEGDYKLSIDSLRTLVPFADMDAEIKQLTVQRMAGKKGQDVKLVADMFGFTDPLAMIEALLTLQPLKEAIAERTQQRMLEEHSGLVDERELELQVQEAIHNEARARFIAIELNALSKAMKPVRFQVAAAKQVAQEILAGKKLSEIRPSEFTRAEARAVKATEEAMKKGDSRAAIKGKRSQLLNNQLAKEAIEVHKEYDKATKGRNALFNKFFNRSDKQLSNKSYPRNTDLINAGRVILASYDVGPTVEDINVFTDNLKKYDEHLYAELEPVILDARASEGQKDLTDLTYEEFLDLRDLALSLWHQSRRAEQIKLAGELVELQPVKDKLNNRLDEIINSSKKLRERKATPVGTTQAVPKLYVWNKHLLDWAAKFTRMESWVDAMDGASGLKKGVGSAVLELEDGKLGDFYNTLWFPMKSALSEYRVQQAIFTKQYSDLVNSVDFGNTEITANEFAMVDDTEESRPYTFGSESNGRGKVELLGALLHTGNDSNKRKLLLGRHWGKLNEDGSLDSTHWDAFEKRMQDEGHLTQNDYDFVQAVWDLNEKMLPLLQRAHRDTEGYYFKTVEATPIFNRFGEFRGGYVPAKGDPNMTQVDLKDEINAAKSEFKNSLPKVQNGMTKERNERFAQPLSLHLGFMTKHIDDTLRYAYIQPVLQDTLKILNSKEFTKKLEIIDPAIKDEMIIPWLKTAASQKTYSPSGFGQGFDRILATIKRNTGIGIMFANIGNAFQQLTGLFPGLIKVKPRHLKNGLIAYMRDREGTNQMIAEMSPFMADRQKNLIFDIQDQLNELLINPNNFQKMQNWGKHHGYFLQQTFQGITDAIVWMGSYNQVHETMSKDMSDEAVMAEAIKQADANVRLTQDSLLPEDRAAYQNMSPIVQSMAQFTGYFNMIANLSLTQYKKLVRDDLGFKNKGKNTEQFLYVYLYTVVLPAVMAGIIMRGLGGRIDDEDDDGYILDDMASAALGDIVNYTAGLVPIAGQIAVIPINRLNNIPWDDSIVSSPSIASLADSVGAPLSLVKTAFTDGDYKGKQIRDVFTAVTVGTGIPVTPLGKTFGYLRDVQRGYVTPKGPIDFVRGVVTGKAGAGK